MAGSWQVLQVNSEICIFCSATQYIVSKKQPAGSAHDVSADSSEIVFDEAHFIANLVPSNPYPSPRHTISPSESIWPPFPQAEQLPKLLLSRHIKNSLSEYLFLNSEPYLGKSEEFNNQGLKVNRNLNAILFFLSKSNKKQTSSAWNY